VVTNGWLDYSIGHTCIFLAETQSYFGDFKK